MNSQKKILIIRTKSMGDVLFTIPAVHAVRRNYPDAHISFLVGSENAALLKGCTVIDEIIELDRSRLKRPLTALPELYWLLCKLRPGRFSLVIDFQGYGETAWLSRFTGAKERWGSVYSWGRRWAYTRGIDRRNDMHPIDWNLFLLQECGLEIGRVENHLHLPEAALEAARKTFTEHDLDPSLPTLYIHPFTSRDHKNWPLSKYLDVAARWRSQGVQVVFGGGPGDVSALTPVQGKGFKVLAGSPLLVSAGFMQLSTLVLGGDTGMLHLANCLGKPALMLMRNVTSGACVLYQHWDWLVASPVKDRIDTLSVDAVLSKSFEVFSETSGVLLH